MTIFIRHQRVQK